MIKIILILFIFSSSQVFTQVTEDWVSLYNGPGNGNDNANSIAVDGSGNVYVTGVSVGTGTGKDYATIKYNSAGVQQWVSRYNGTGNTEDIAKSMKVDGEGNVYVTGSSWGGASNYDYATVKYNSSGIEQWVQRYNASNGYDYANSIAIDGSGNVYVTGESVGSGGNFDYVTIKYNTSGVQQWVGRYNGLQNGSDYANSIAVDGSGNVYVTGRVQWSGNDNDYGTLKYNTSGVLQWDHIYNGPGNDWDEANSIAVDGSGNVYVTGYSISSGTLSDYATLKINSSGVGQWASRYTGPGNSSDRAYAIAVDGTGNVYVTGRSFGSGTDWDYGTIKYNSSGDQQWVGRYNGPFNAEDFAYSVAVDGSGNVYVTGNSFGIYADYATIRYSSSGVQQWAARYNGLQNGSDHASAIALDGSGNVYVTGSSLGIGSTDNYATIKYSQPIGITPISSEIPKEFSLGQNYPNPFNPSTKIKFEIPVTPLSFGEGLGVRLTIYDNLGRQIETLVNQQLSPGTYEVDFDGSRLSSGTYYYRLSSDIFSEAKKLILIK